MCRFVVFEIEFGALFARVEDLACCALRHDRLMCGDGCWQDLLVVQSLEDSCRVLVRMESEPDFDDVVYKGESRRVVQCFSELA